ncbi:MAG: hypothetical protein K9G05_04295 [Candidatus Nanopelagicales bacterium]|nr:hypothetical protein [Candidatus Nanopelagicales bacterium]
MTFLFVVLAIAVLAALFAVIMGRWAPDMGVPTVGDNRPEPQFDVTLRGYRMDEVDSTIAALEATIAELEKKSR